MQPNNYPMQQGPPEQNYKMDRNRYIPPNRPMQENFQIPQNAQGQQNFQMQQNSPMRFEQQIPENSPNQQNFQRYPNQQMHDNQEIPQNFQNQQNFHGYQQNQQMNANVEMQQNFQRYPNQQIPENQEIPQNNQDFRRFSNPQINENPEIPQNILNQQNMRWHSNQQVNGNYGVPQNPGMQPNNASLTGSQSRPLPPPIPRNSSQNCIPSMQRVPSQRIPLRTTTSNGSIDSMTLQQSMRFNSMASMQSMGSSDSEDTMQLQRPLSRQNSSQFFPVVYNNITYKVDPELLCNASPKIKEMLLPVMQENRLGEAHLEIFGHSFTYRNINNFLKLCQNLPTDVQNSEMEEICEIAKMFGAEKIYNTGAAFIRQNMDPNFSIPDSKYDGSDGKKYLAVDDERHVIHHSSDMQANLVNGNDNDDEYDDEESDDNNEAKQNPSPPPAAVDNKPSEKPQEIDTSKISSVIYTVKAERHALKCNVYHFYSGDDVLFTAKKKNENIYVGEGYDVHIRRNQKNHVAHISQDDSFHNIIFLKDKNFNLKYVDSGKPNHLSLNVSFPLNKDKMITWVPKPPKYDPVTDRYFLNFHGEHHHTPIKSKKNIVLQNERGNPTFIVRKMDNELYEIECLPIVDPLIAFVIGLSDIVGPYFDPCGEIKI